VFLANLKDGFFDKKLLAKRLYKMRGKRGVSDNVYKR